MPKKKQPIQLDKDGKAIKKKSKVPYILLAIMLLLGAGVGIIFYLSTQGVVEIGHTERPEFAEPIYSKLTGLEISDENLNNSPTYCVQIPNGSNDGARPQAGLSQAAVVFEAIAEAGITRFAAIFQNPTVSVIGPVRSLRLYYLDWDTPFDCTVVHAGGSPEALAAISSGGQRDLTENLTYMWRENSASRNWNNLFTSPQNLNQFNSDKGYTTSSPKVWPRYTPDQTTELLAKYQQCGNEASEASDSSNCPTETAHAVDIAFTNSYTHNVHYDYDSTSNTYLRSHQDGKPHLNYICDQSLNQPNTLQDCGDPVQIAPNVVIAMRVQESLDSDNYHQKITTIGSGKATIFQNGTITHGTWKKSSQNSQIVFTDDAGQEVSLTPGQIWIAAVPQYGSVDWE